MITIKDWKDITTFEPIKDGILDVDGTIQRIAKIKNISIEEVEAMDVSDLLPEYLNCVRTVNESVFAKISKLPKNGDGDGV